MATNFYFNNFPAGQITSEQLLVEDLVIEALKIYGMDVYYLPRSSGDSKGADQLYGEDVSKQYLSAHAIEMYMENITGMEGEQDFISKFGLEIRDEVTLLVSRKRFKYVVGASNFNVPRLGDIVATENDAPKRPREGDLVYIPLVQNFFEIIFVEHENDQAMFHTLGRGRGGNVNVYALKLKQYVFSDELISTGIAEVDEQAFGHYRRTRLHVPINGSGKFLQGEVIYQGANTAYATAKAIVSNWNPARYVDVIRVVGNFEANVTLKGATSNAQWLLANAANDMITTKDVFEDVNDNQLLQEEGNLIIDFTEVNPFGEP